MPSFSKSIIRLQLSVVSNPPVYPIDVNTELAPQIWRSSDVEFQVGVFDQFGSSVDLSNLDFLEFDIFPMPALNLLADTNFNYNPYSVSPYPNMPPAPLQFVTIPKTAITAKVNLRDWKNGLAQQASAWFTWNQTQALQLNGSVYRDFWLNVQGLAGNQKIPYGGCRLRVYESGSQAIYLPNDVAPLDVPLDTILYIPPNKQLTFHQTISVEGTITADGILIQV